MSLNRYITLKQAKTQEGKSVKDIMKRLFHLKNCLKRNSGKKTASVAAIGED